MLAGSALAGSVAAGIDLGDKLEHDDLGATSAVLDVADGQRARGGEHARARPRHAKNWSGAPGLIAARPPPWSVPLRRLSAGTTFSIFAASWYAAALRCGGAAPIANATSSALSSSSWRSNAAWSKQGRLMRQ